MYKIWCESVQYWRSYSKNPTRATKNRVYFLSSVHFGTLLCSISNPNPGKNAKPNLILQKIILWNIVYQKKTLRDSSNKNTMYIFPGAFIGSSSKASKKIYSWVLSKGYSRNSSKCFFNGCIVFHRDAEILLKNFYSFSSEIWLTFASYFRFHEKV